MSDQTKRRFVQVPSVARTALPCVASLARHWPLGHLVSPLILVMHRSNLLKLYCAGEAVGGF